MSPVWPPSRLTKAPKWVMPLTVPWTTWPARLSVACEAPLADAPLDDAPLAGDPLEAGG
jgi:hypothetical protein